MLLIMAIVVPTVLGLLIFQDLLKIVSESFIDAIL